MDSNAEKKKAKKLFEQLTRHNSSPSSHVLYEKVCEFVTSMVQDDICLKQKSHGNRFRDLLCEFSLAYVPVPLQDQMKNHAGLVNGQHQLGEGSNGRIFKSGSFQGNPIVTKTKKKINDHSIYEIYINFVVLNSMLLEGQYESNFIPTYGLFLCPTNSDGTEICVPIHKQEHLFLVQKEMEGHTLAHHLQSGMELYQYKSIVHEIFQVLQALEKSPHQLYHTDLHCSNIMMCNDHPVLLDFELCSFSVDSHRFRLNSLEHKYCGNDHVLSGAHDLVLLFSNSMAYKANRQICEYTFSVLQHICSHFWSAPHQPLEVTKDFFFKHKERRWLFSILEEKEAELSHQHREMVHTFNVSVLRKMTYQYLATEFGF